MVEPQDFQAQGERNGDALRANKLLTSSCGRSHDLSVRQQQKGHKILHLTSNKFLQKCFPQKASCWDCASQTLCGEGSGFLIYLICTLIHGPAMHD